MQAYQLQPGASFQTLSRQDLHSRPLQPHEVRVRIGAAGLNFRDLMVADGSYPTGFSGPLVPLGDAAGTVIETGASVQRFKAGDRVVNTYFPGWVDGHPTPANTAGSYGVTLPGVLADEAVFDEQALAVTPSHLDDVEAATIACAGITAWNALFVEGGLQPGGAALMLGTGGVSIWALQLAHAAGARTFITSSDDGKLARARELGAHETINYRTHPEWQQEVLARTQAEGVDVVVEVGGNGTLARSVAASRMGGRIALVGGVSGFSSELNLLSVIGGARRLAGIYVGSRRMFEDLLRFVSLHQLRPVVDRAFGFGDAAQAYARIEGGRHFGKVVVDVTRR